MKMRMLAIVLLMGIVLSAATVTKVITLPGGIVETVTATVNTVDNTRLVTQTIVIYNSTIVRTITVVPGQGAIVKVSPLNATNVTARMRIRAMVNATNGTALGNMTGKGMRMGMNATATMGVGKGRMGGMRATMSTTVTVIPWYSTTTTTPWWGRPTPPSTPSMPQQPAMPGASPGMGGHGRGR